MTNAFQGVTPEDFTEFYEKSREVAGKAAEKAAAKAMEQIREWMPEDRKTLYTVAGAAVAVGVLGYWLGSSRRPAVSAVAEKNGEPGEVGALGRRPDPWP